MEGKLDSSDSHELNAQGVASKYLYFEPVLTPKNLSSFIASLERGERRWSDLNLYLNPTPGRWVTSLDLTSLTLSVCEPLESMLGHGETSRKDVERLLQLTPCLQHLALPYFSFEYLRMTVMPCAKHLRSLHGIHLRGYSSAGILRLLASLANLETLSVSGAWTVRYADEKPSGCECPLRTLPRLHTLSLAGFLPPVFFDAIMATGLPTVRHLCFKGEADASQLATVLERDWRRGRVTRIRRAHIDVWSS